jgi:hypothetical protein
VKDGDPAELKARLEPVKEKVQARAYELFCERSHRATPLDDWVEAEHEANLLHLSGVAEEGDGFRVTGCVPRDYASADISIEAFPGEIVVEALRRGRVERFTRLRMPTPIDTSRVRAYLNGFELEVTAPKASAPTAARGATR